MAEVSSIPNIGPVVKEKLKQVGIETVEDLYSIGSLDAFSRIRSIDPTACINMLFALEGAIQGIRWNNLSKEDKDRLKGFYNSLL